eukprot:TRINITY_DN28241_c0_g1_i1.p1 TRINITY_DN28241_c0_g1~~TRINITY_DN28241_c0_g1_i1.p1  ORF type:complete len:144 (+),score=33.01 TRINITY_DN28241_c0_g1_i1:167-598(+)
MAWSPWCRAAIVLIAFLAGRDGLMHTLAEEVVDLDITDSPAGMLGSELGEGSQNATRNASWVNMSNPLLKGLSGKELAAEIYSIQSEQEAEAHAEKAAADADAEAKQTAAEAEAHAQKAATDAEAEAAGHENGTNSTNTTALV